VSAVEKRPHAPLTPGNEEWMADCRAWVRGAVADVADFDSVAATKLRVVEAIGQHVRPGETWKLQALGVVFGDALALAYGLEWVQVAEGLDAIPALLLREVPEPVYAYPVTMISKRREAGLELDYIALVELAENVVRAAR
jgi:hypothetical protein